MLTEKRSIKTGELLGYVYNNVVYTAGSIEAYKAEKEKQDENFEPNETYEEILKAIANNEIEEDPTYLDRLKKQKIKELNNARDTELANLKVKFTLQDGQEAEFDADETSQTRLTRALLTRALNGLKDGEKIVWIGTDYKIYELTKEDCYNGLRVAGELQTQLFAKCAELKGKVLQAQTEDEVKAVVWD